MRKLMMVSLVSFGLLAGAFAFGDDVKKVDSGTATPAPTPSATSGSGLNGQTIEKKSEEKKEEQSETKRPFHFPGRSS
jgi:hypothetical protein